MREASEGSTTTGFMPIIDCTIVAGSECDDITVKLIKMGAIIPKTNRASSHLPTFVRVLLEEEWETIRESHERVVPPGTDKVTEWSFVIRALVEIAQVPAYSRELHSMPGFSQNLIDELARLMCRLQSPPIRHSESYRCQILMEMASSTASISLQSAVELLQRHDRYHDGEPKRISPAFLFFRPCSDLAGQHQRLHDWGFQGIVPLPARIPARFRVQCSWSAPKTRNEGRL